MNLKFHTLEVEVADGIGYVRMKNGKENRFSAEFAQDLMSAAKFFQNLEGIKVIVLGSAAEDFSIGVPYEEALNASMDEEYQTIVLACRAIEEWSKLPYPIIAAIQGRCSSLGLSLACIADIRIVAANTLFTVPEIQYGLVPAGGITQRLTRLIGKGPAMSMLLGAMTLNGDEAIAYGLATKITTEDALWQSACEEAKELSRLSTLSLQYTKECLLRGSELSFNQGLRLELDVYMLLQTSRDRMEGVEAFLEKRTPQFLGE